MFRDNAGEWCVLAVRAPAEDDRLVCVLPLRRDTEAARLAPAGDLIWSFASGWLCDPAFDPHAVRITAEAVRAMDWTTFKMTQDRSESRLRAFVEAFGDDPEAVIETRTAAQAACHPVTLPQSFQSYLKGMVAKPASKALQRIWRRRFKTGAWRVRQSTPDTALRDIDFLVAQWEQRERTTKGAENAHRAAQNYRALLVNALRADALSLHVLWEDNLPLGAIAHILDHDMDRVHFALTAWDRGATKAPLGLLLHASAIQWSIEHGFETYDFGKTRAVDPELMGAAPLETGAARITRLD